MPERVAQEECRNRGGKDRAGQPGIAVNAAMTFQRTTWRRTRAGRGNSLDHGQGLRDLDPAMACWYRRESAWRARTACKDGKVPGR
jgi:hypothetical protein